MIGFTNKELEDLYKELGSVKEVAKFLKMPYSTLHYHFRENKLGNYIGRGPCVSKEELVSFHDEYGSITKVAAEIGRNYATVRSWYSYYDIIVNKSSMTVFQEIRETPMSAANKSIVVGSILGDGTLRKPSKSKNVMLEISHCEKQLGYLKWKQGMLSPFSRKIRKCEEASLKLIGDIKVNASNFFRFNTICHPDITSLYNESYVDGYKGVSKSLVEKIDLLAMAVWFADDGSIKRGRDRIPCGASIATNSFTYEENVMLIGAVSKFFKGKIYTKKVTNKYKGQLREYYLLYLSGKEPTVNFLKEIKSVLPSCIYYKLS